MSNNVIDFVKRTDNFEEFYQFGRTLGQGNFAICRLATHKPTKTKWAVKVVNKATLEPGDLKSLEVEIEILSRVMHPYIVSSKEVYDSGGDSCLIVMELMTGGEMFDRIVSKETYTEIEAKNAIKQIIEAIDYCHDQNIVHRDIKPENLLYASPDENAPLKLADFGLAAIVQAGVPMTAGCGTPSYVAPEILKGDPKGYGKEVDLWSIGIILYILLCGFPPFYDEDNSNLFARIQAAKFEFPSPYWDQVSYGAKDLVSKLLVLDPKKRFTTKQTLAHPWMADSTVKDLPNLDIRDNLRSFNARRRMKGLIRTVQMITMMKRRIGGGGGGSSLGHGLADIQKVIDSNKAPPPDDSSLKNNIAVVPVVEASAT